MTDWNGNEAKSSVVVPSGYTIEYEAKPKRLYRIDGVEVPSVTTVLDCLDKPGLSWWGMQVGVAGVLHLSLVPGGLGELSSDVYSAAQQMRQYDVPAKKNPIVKEITAKLTEHKKTVNHVRDEAGTRGQTVHDALERWAVTGEKPDARDYPSTEQGYVIGLLAFLNDVPTLTAEGVEMMVGSKEHGYAGRFDLRASTSETHTVVLKVYPKAKPKLVDLPAGKAIWDLKTSSDVYGEHVIQIGAYEHASVECGYEPTDHRVIIHVTEDGRYEVRRSRCTIEHFLAVKTCGEALKFAEESIKVGR
jgi:hypothetical protein